MISMINKRRNKKFMTSTNIFPNLDEISYLILRKEERYPPIKLSSRNSKEFENRCCEIIFSEQILESMMADIFTDPEEIIFSYRMDKEISGRYFKFNKKRTDFIERMVQVVDYLDKELKIYRGELV